MTTLALERFDWIRYYFFYFPTFWLMSWLKMTTLALEGFDWIRYNYTCIKIYFIFLQTFWLMSWSLIFFLSIFYFLKMLHGSFCNMVHAFTHTAQFEWFLITDGITYMKHVSSRVILHIIKLIWSWQFLYIMFIIWYMIHAIFALVQVITSIGMFLQCK